MTAAVVAFVAGALVIGAVAWVLCRRWDRQPPEGAEDDPLNRDVPPWRLRWESWRHGGAA